MKNCILKGLCLFFILTTLFLLAVPVLTAAVSGQGGSTEVVARIEPQTTDQETQPLPTQPVTVDNHPIQTGEVIAWYVMICLSVCGSVIILFRLKARCGHQKRKSVEGK